MEGQGLSWFWRNCSVRLLIKGWACACQLCASQHSVSQQLLLTIWMQLFGRGRSDWFCSDQTIKAGADAPAFIVWSSTVWQEPSYFFGPLGRLGRASGPRVDGLPGFFALPGGTKRLDASDARL